MLEFNILLASNTYFNYSSLITVLPVQIKKRTNAAQNIDTDMITVKNVFAHWLKEVDIKRYQDDISILPTSNTVDIYRYSEKMVKHLHAKSLDVIKETLPYDKETVITPGCRDRRSSTSQTPGDRTDKNLGSTVTNFHDVIRQKLYCRMSLKYFVDLGLVNFPEKTDTKFIFTLESNMNKLFESNARVNAIPARCSNYIP